MTQPKNNLLPAVLKNKDWQRNSVLRIKSNWFLGILIIALLFIVASSISPFLIFAWFLYAFAMLVAWWVYALALLATGWVYALALLATGWVLVMPLIVVVVVIALVVILVLAVA